MSYALPKREKIYRSLLSLTVEQRRHIPTIIKNKLIPINRPFIESFSKENLRRDAELFRKKIIKDCKAAGIWVVFSTTKEELANRKHQNKMLT